MATKSVRFVFHIIGTIPKDIVTYHDLPASLVCADSHLKIANDPIFTDLFSTSVLPIVRSKQFWLFEQASKECITCSQPSTAVIQNPATFLHEVDDPCVLVTVIPYCGKTECQMAYRQKQLAEMAALDDIPEVQQYRAEHGLPSSHKPIASCRVCDKTDGSRFCQGCKMIAYCGKEHQKLDWKEHKRVCKALSEGRPL